MLPYEVKMAKREGGGGEDSVQLLPKTRLHLLRISSFSGIVRPSKTQIGETLVRISFK